MRHQVRKKRFDRHSSHRIAMFRNMVTSLIESERITTTLAKAKELRRVAEKMVTLAKKGSLHARRQAAAYVRTPDAVKKLFAELGPRFMERKGGYTRIYKLGNRLGDGAEMALIEYLGYQPKVKKAKGEKAPAEEKADKKAKPAKAKKADKKADKAEAKPKFDKKPVKNKEKNLDKPKRKAK